MYNPAYTLFMKIGPNLKKIRKRQGVTQVELAQKLGVTQPTIADYESGRINPEAGKVLKIAQTLDVSVEALYGVAAQVENMNGRPRSRKAKKAEALFLQLKPKEQQLILKTMKGLLGAAQGGKAKA